MAFHPSFGHAVVATAVVALAVSRVTQDSFTLTLFKCAGPALAIFLFYVSWLYPFYISPLRNVPTVPGFPLWGQFVDIVTSEVGVPQREWHKKYGLIIRYFFPFGAERLSIAEDEALKHMTVKNPYNYPKPVRAKLWMMRILGEGVLLAEGDAHVHQRKALNPAFSPASIKDLSLVFWRKGLLLTDIWRRKFAEMNVKQWTFEVLEWLNRTTLDIIGEAAFGEDIDSLEEPETPLRRAYRMVFAFDFFSRALHGIQAFIPASKHLPVKMNRDMQASRHIIASKASDIVQSKQENVESNNKDIISLIVKDNEKLKQSGGQGLSFETMRDQVMTFLGAGHDTTATGIAWTLGLLAKHPEIQERLRAEIRGSFPALFDANSRENFFEDDASHDVDQLHYLNNVCREGLRYIPPIPMTVRQTIAEDTLGGHTIPPGTTVYVLANAINRLPHYWGPTVDKFDPDRWDNLPDTYTQNAYMTFLQGPRGCIGRKFAETEMKILLCCLLSMFTFERNHDVPDPEDWKMWRLVLRPKDGISLNAFLLE